MFDWILRGGTVIDGSRRPRYVADVGLVGDRIDSIGDLREASARQEFDAAGLAVAPGFIDVHNHTDGWMLKAPDLDVKVRQGFTTELLMSDGIGYAPLDDDTAIPWIFYQRALNALRVDEYTGWKSINDYQRRLDRRTLQNHAVQIPYANCRSLAAGFGRGPLDDLQRKLVRAEIRRGMEAGATGLSTGLDYLTQPYATTDDLVDACSAMRDYHGIYVTHMRYKQGLMPALQEAVEIGRRAGVAVHISHLKASSDRDGEEILRYIDDTARHEVDFTFDIYPYQPGSTMLNFLLPYEVWDDGPLAVTGRLLDPGVRRRFRRALDDYALPLDDIFIAWLPSVENRGWLGKSLRSYIDASGVAPEDALLRLLIEERLSVLLVFGQGDDALVHPFLQHELGMIGSDGIYFPDSVVHPRVTGTAPRVLGRAVRDWRLFSLEDAVHKLSTFAAERFGLPDRGKIEAGAAADLVIFDPQTVDDRGTFRDPQQSPVGIRQVLVNGEVAFADDGDLPTRTSYPGRALRYQPTE